MQTVFGRECRTKAEREPNRNHLDPSAVQKGPNNIEAAILLRNAGPLSANQVSSIWRQIARPGLADQDWPTRIWLTPISSLIAHRYRLIRHVWNINVNESVSVDATCTLDDIRSHDIGIDVYVKNLNQVHHPLITEIFLNKVDVLCPTYKLNPDKVNCECLCACVLGASIIRPENAHARHLMQFQI